jgi:GTP-binding protein EngB required for normal cell division
MADSQAQKVATKIRDDDLADYLPRMAHKWFQIALKLDCRDKALTLNSDKGGAERNCFEVILAWTEKDVEASWEKLCGVLRSPAVELNSLADEIEQKFCPNSAIVAVSTDTEVKDKLERCDSSFGGVEPPRTMFTRRMERVLRNPDHDIWETEEQRDKKIQIIIDEYFLKHKERETESIVVSREVAQLEKNDFIVGEMVAIAHEKVEEYERMLSDDSMSLSDSSCTSVTEDEEPLFSKSNTYHALLCCLAVHSSTEEKEIRRVINEHGHEFQCLSVSRSDCRDEHGMDGFHGTYLIARRGDVRFVAFNGICELSVWGKYQSYSAGLLKQARNIPANYLFHLVRNKKKVILTGFSFGGALASTVMANIVCDNDIINQDVMERNLCCITFGQPLIADDALSEMLARKESLCCCIHHIYTEDVVPTLMRYTFANAVRRQSCDGQGANVPETAGKVCRIMEEVSNLQRLSSQGCSEKDKRQLKKNSKTSLAKIQQEIDRLNKAEKGVTAESIPLPPGSYHCIRPTQILAGDPPHSKLEFTDLDRQSVSKMLSKLKEKEFSLDSFSKHIPKQYFSSVFANFVDTPPKYLLPDVDHKRDLPQAIVDAPQIVNVDIYCWDEDVNVVISGNNLWFTRNATVYKLRNMSCCLQTNNCSQLRVSTIIQEKVSEFIRKLPRVPKVKLENCFLAAVTEEKEVKTKTMSVPACNVQIAKLAPQQLIVLAVLSTVMENVVPDGLNSERYESVHRFLKDSLETVPAESLFIAGNTNSHGDEYCRSTVQKLMARNTDKGIPPSGSMLRAMDTFVAGIFLHNQSVNIFERHIKPSLTQQLPPGANVNLAYREPLDDRMQEYLRLQRGKMVKELHRRRSVPPLCGEGLHCILNRTEIPLHIVNKERAQVMQITQEQLGCVSLCQTEDAPYNERFLEVGDRSLLWSVQLACVLDSFMSMTVKVPFVQNPEMTAKALERGGPTIGMWYLVGRNYVQFMQELVKNKPLVIDVSNYLEKYLDKKCNPDSEGYDSKIGFILQAMSQPITYSVSYISYSLEMQLKALCEKLNITATTPVLEIRREWDKSFKGTALAHVAAPIRPIISRWIKWMLVTNRLREALAKRTTIGIMGLLNSGKSHLLNCLFHTKAPTGTRDAMRTTIPMVYNMDSQVKKLDVVDFPGVDDSDVRVQNLCKVMFGLVQIAVFVVDYRKAHSNASMNILKYIARAGIPVLICLTHADKLISEIMSGIGNLPDVLDSQRCIDMTRKSFLQKYRKCLNESPPECVEMACFAFDKDSIFAFNGGRKHMKDAGVKDHTYVANWIMEMVRRQGQVEQAKLMEEFFHHDA